MNTLSTYETVDFSFTKKFWENKFENKKKELTKVLSEKELCLKIQKKMVSEQKAKARYAAKDSSHEYAKEIFDLNSLIFWKNRELEINHSVDQLINECIDLAQKNMACTFK